MPLLLVIIEGGDDTATNLRAAEAETGDEGAVTKGGGLALLVALAVVGVVCWLLLLLACISFSLRLSRRWCISDIDGRCDCFRGWGIRVIGEGGSPASRFRRSSTVSSSMSDIAGLSWLFRFIFIVYYERRRHRIVVKITPFHSSHTLTRGYGCYANRIRKLRTHSQVSSFYSITY